MFYTYYRCIWKNNICSVQFWSQTERRNQVWSVILTLKRKNKTFIGCCGQKHILLTIYNSNREKYSLGYNIFLIWCPPILKKYNSRPPNIFVHVKIDQCNHSKSTNLPFHQSPNYIRSGSLECLTLFFSWTSPAHPLSTSGETAKNQGSLLY